jgi:hypothetical protein
MSGFRPQAAWMGLFYIRADVKALAVSPGGSLGPHIIGMT